MGPLSYPILRIGRYGKGPMNSTDDPYFSTLVGPRTHCFQFVKISLHTPYNFVNFKQGSSHMVRMAYNIHIGHVFSAAC